MCTCSLTLTTAIYCNDVDNMLALCRPFCCKTRVTVAAADQPVAVPHRSPHGHQSALSLPVRYRPLAGGLLAEAQPHRRLLPAVLTPHIRHPAAAPHHHRSEFTHIHSLSFIYNQYLLCHSLSHRHLLSHTLFSYMNCHYGCANLILVSVQCLQKRISD